MDTILVFLGQYLGQSSPTLVIILILGYFLKLFIEKRLQGIAGKVDEISRTSLAIKKDIRLEERNKLVEFREAVEKWEDFLQSVLFDYAMKTSTNTQIEVLYKKDRELFLEVKLAVVKVCIFLRDKELEKKLMDIVLKIRQVYYPIIYNSLPRLVDIQLQLRQYERKLNLFEKSGFKDMAFAPYEKDREENLKLQESMNAELKIFAEISVEQYGSIAAQIYDLKDAINQYIYRPIGHTAINRD